MQHDDQIISNELPFFSKGVTQIAMIVQSLEEQQWTCFGICSA